MFETLPYQTIQEAEKFPTLSLMKRPLLLSACLAAACAPSPGASAPAPSGPIIELRESFTCPLPPSRALITVTRDGKAERVVFEGLSFELGKTRSTRESMTLSPSDTGELFRLVTDSRWRSMPEHADEFPLHGRPTCADCCSGALLIKTAQGGKSLRFASDRKPKELESLMNGIDAILSHGEWTRVVYPWEKQGDAATD